jgi:hypothetical protein
MIDPIIYTTKPDMAKVPGGWEPNIGSATLKHLLQGDDCSQKVTIFKGLIGEAFLIKDLLTSESCDELILLMANAPKEEEVSVQGMMTEDDKVIGSRRVTMWSPVLAESIWGIIAKHFEKRTMYYLTSTDWWQGSKSRNKWEPVGITPMLRFMRYEYGGEHYAHYDAGFIYPSNDNYRTLQSFVIYLTTNATGATRFVQDKQDDRRVWDREHNDWKRSTRDHEVLFNSYPIKGSMLVFDHRMCHDVSPYTDSNGPRIIIRGDVLYKAV